MSSFLRYIEHPYNTSKYHHYVYFEVSSGTQHLSRAPEFKTLCNLMVVTTRLMLLLCKRTKRTVTILFQDSDQDISCSRHTRKYFFFDKTLYQNLTRKWFYSKDNLQDYGVVYPFVPREILISPIPYQLRESKRDPLVLSIGKITVCSWF